MKILYISLDPRQPINARTGGALHMREIVNALTEEGHEVMVSAPGMGDQPEHVNGEQSGGTFKKIIKTITPSFMWLLARDLNDIRADRRKEAQLETVADDFKPDVIYERNAYLFASGARVASSRDIPYFLEINAPTVEERREQFGAPMGGWHRRVEAFQTRLARGIVVVSEPIQRYLTQSGVDPAKIRVVPNGVRPGRFEGTLEKGNKQREIMNLEGPVIGFVGSLAGYHGLDRLFKALPGVLDKFPTAKALVVGGGPLLEQTRALAIENGLGDAVIFAGSVEPDEVPAYIGTFNVGVLPRTAEYCSPIKLFEYGAAGVPVIAPSTAPIASILGPKGEGILLEEGDSLGEAIISLLEDGDKARKMGAAFQKRVLSNYTWRNAARRILRLIEERI